MSKTDVTFYGTKFVEEFSFEEDDGTVVSGSIEGINKSFTVYMEGKEVAWLSSIPECEQWVVDYVKEQTQRRSGAMPQSMRSCRRRKCPGGGGSCGAARRRGETQS